jgi:hypothetical protein
MTMPLLAALIVRGGRLRRVYLGLGRMVALHESSSTSSHIY